MIVFDKSIYREEAIRKACADYRELAEINMNVENDYIFCEITNAESDNKLVANEFCNYVLDLTVMMSGA